MFKQINEGELENLLQKKIPKNSIYLKKDNKIVKNYLDYCSIGTDLSLVVENISYLIELRIKENKLYKNKTYNDKEFMVKRSLFISSILSYNRCFNNSKGRLSLNLSVFNKDFPNDLLNKENTLNFHKKLVSLRNKLIAHSDTHPSEELVAYIEFKKNGKYIDTMINYIYSTQYAFDETELENFLILTKLLIKIVEKQKEKVSGKILSDIGNNELIKIGMKILKY